MTSRQRSGDAGAGQAGMVLGLAAMDRVEVEGRGAGTLGHHRHRGTALGQPRPQVALEPLDHRRHVADGAVAEERHRAVGDPAEGLDLGPPDAAMADADPVDIERLGNDHMVDPRLGEEALPREPGDSAIAAGFLVDRAGDLESAGQLGRHFPAGSRRRRSRRRGRPSCRRCRARNTLPSRISPAHGSTLHPCPAGTTSMWPLKCTQGPAGRSRGGRPR